MGTLALIALGSNLGDRAATLDRAIADLADAPGVSVRAVSRYHATAPVGGPGGQGAFLNAAAALETTLEPAELHLLLLDVEHRAGRVREARWDARTLDLDLILFGDRIIDTPDLTVPHPRFAVRRFVLAPLAEVAPDDRDPVTGRTVLELLLQLDRRPSFVAIDRSADPGLTRDVALDIARRLDCQALLPDLLPPAPGMPAGGRIRAVDLLATAVQDLIEMWDHIRGSGGPSWIVSDFIPAREWDRHLASLLGAADTGTGQFLPGANEYDGLSKLIDPVSERIERAPTPTFMVLPKWSGRISDLSELESGIALLVPDRDDREGIVSEILAACEASRAGIGTP